MYEAHNNPSFRGVIASCLFFHLPSINTMTTTRSFGSPTLLHSLLLVLAAACSPSVCHGWGTTGHEIVANVAWSQLSNETRAWVVQVLNATGDVKEDGKEEGDNDDDDPGSILGAVADWADRVRHFLPWSAPLHYIDVRDDLFSNGCHIAPHLNPQCRFDYDRDCPNNTCVAGAIVNYTHQLLRVGEPHQMQQLQQYLRRSNSRMNDQQVLVSSKELSNNIPKTKEALMFLTHFIGDIHQPLHCSRTTDKGGNDFHVHFNLAATTTAAASSIHHPHGWNLHSIWDTGLLDVALARDYNNSRVLLEQALLAELVQDKSSTTTSAIIDDYLSCDKALGANQTCTIQWGQESWDMAIRYAYTLDDNQTDVSDGATLDEDYYETRWPMAKERLLAGAVRLAGTLEWIVHENNNNNNREEELVQSKYSTKILGRPVLMGSSIVQQEPSSWAASFLPWFSWNARIMFAARRNY